MARYLLLIPFFFTTFLANAQDLSGTWEGSSTNAANYVMMVIVKQGNNYVGYTYDDGAGYCKANFIGSFDTDKQQLNGKGVSFIETSYSHTLMKLRLNYHRYGDEHFLSGFSIPKSILGTLLFFASSDRVVLKRISLRADTTFFMRDYLQTKVKPEIEETDTVSNNFPSAVTEEPPIDTAKTITPPPSRDKIAIAKKERSLDTISTIVTSEKNITITIFDNGQVDGDTVTIFHNNHVLLSNHFVSATPYKISITLSREQPRHEIVFVANNLGSIPPNTAVLIVDAGEKRYRVNASADMQKNALLVLEFRE